MYQRTSNDSCLHENQITVNRQFRLVRQMTSDASQIYILLINMPNLNESFFQL